MTQYLQNILNYSVIFEKIAGVLGPPPDMVKPIMDFVYQSYAEKSWALALDYIKSLNSTNEIINFGIFETADKFNDTVKYLQQYTIEPNDIPHAVKSFKLDTTNWPYSKHNLNKFFYITVIINFTSKGKDIATWDEKNLELNIPAPIGNKLDLQKAFIYIREAVIHELTHASQTLLNKTLNQDYIAGLPPKHLINKEYTPEGFSQYQSSEDVNAEPNQMHSLRALEFHPRVQDAISEFNNEIYAFRKFLYLNNLPFSKKYVRTLFKSFIGAKPKIEKSIIQYIKQVKPPYYIREILKNEPEKWKILVKYLYTHYIKYLQ